MLDRLRKIFESIAYAGLKSKAPSGVPEGGKPGGLRGMLDRLISGPAPTDPLYLTNRTWKQKLRVGLAIGIPCLLLAGAVGLALSHLYAPKAPPPKEPTPAEIVAHLLPDLEKTVDNTPREVEILDLHPDTAGAPKIVGTLRNNTDRTVSVEFTADLTDASGSKLDAVTERVEKAPAKSSVSFQFPIDDKDAAFSLVRPRSLRIVD
jgi:hypothetical protein